MRRRWVPVALGLVALALLVPAVIPFLAGGGASPANAADAGPLHLHAAGGGAAQPLPPIPDAESGAIVPGQPFYDPPVITSRNGVLKADLTASAQRVTISGKTVNARVYNGAFMPPVLRARPGDRLLIVPHHLGEPARDGEILEAQGAAGGAPFLVRWEDTGRVSLFYPGSDARIERLTHG